MRENFPQLIVEAALVRTDAVQPDGTFILGDATDGVLGTNTLGGTDTWSDLSSRLRSGGVSRSATRTQGPLWQYQAGTMSAGFRNEDGALDPDNLAGPFVLSGKTQLTAMVPIRVRASWRGVTYSLFRGFTDSWATDDGTNYGRQRYAEAAVEATDGFKVLAGINLAQSGSVGSGEDSGARVRRVLNKTGWYSGQRHIAAGDSDVQATTFGSDALSLMQLATDSEIGELYINGAGQVVFRNRHALLEDDRSNTVQAVFGDSPGTVGDAGVELVFQGVQRVRDDTTIANDVQAQCVDGAAQEVTNSASILKTLFPRTYSRTDLILTNDTETLEWAHWVLSISKDPEIRFDQLIINPEANPENLWPQVLGRELGDRIRIIRRPPDVYSDTYLDTYEDLYGGGPGSVIGDCFIRGIEHSWDASGGTWLTTFTLQDASKYGSFLTLGNPTLGRLGHNALAY